MARRDEKKADQKADKKRKKSDRFFYISIPFLVVLAALAWLKRGFPDPWRDVASGAQVACLVVVAFLILKSYPHPMKSFSRSLAEERRQVRREKRRKKKGRR